MSRLHILSIVFFASTKTISPGGSYHAERISSLILVVAAGLVALEWGPRMLTGNRTAEAVAR